MKKKEKKKKTRLRQGYGGRGEKRAVKKRKKAKSLKSQKSKRRKSRVHRKKKIGKIVEMLKHEPKKELYVKKNAKKTALAVSGMKIPEEMIHKTKIRVIGIGGGAGSIVSEIAPDIKKADFIVANTDTKSLNELTAKVRHFQFGQNVTKGIGTGMNDQLGELAALNEKEEIKKLLKGQDLCIIVSCLGGGTSSGATPVFARISKNMGILTYGIFTLPFDFEGERKMEMAEASLEKTKPYLNAYSIIPNERIFQIIDKNTPLKSAFSSINKRLADNLEGLIEMIYFPGLINIDFMDLGAVLSGKGKLSYLNTTEIEGLTKEDSVKKVISSSLYPYTIKGAKGVLYNIKGGTTLKLAEVSYISKIISESINKQAKIIFGITQNKNLKEKIRITLLAVGCGKKFTIPRVRQKARKIVRKEKTKKRIFSKIKKRKIKKISKNKSGVKKQIIKKKLKNKKIKSSAQTTGKETGNLIAREVHVKVRRNGLQLKRAVEEAEREILEQEKIWETPAILRKNSDENQ